MLTGQPNVASPQSQSSAFSGILGAGSQSGQGFKPQKLVFLKSTSKIYSSTSPHPRTDQLASDSESNHAFPIFRSQKGEAIVEGHEVNRSCLLTPTLLHSLCPPYRLAGSCLGTKLGSQLIRFITDTPVLGRAGPGS